VARPKKGGKSDRPASVPAPATTSDEAGRQPTRPLRRLEFWDGVLGNSTKTRNMIRIVRAVTIALAAIIATLGILLVSAPSGPLQWLATVLLSSASTALLGAAGIRIHGRRARPAGRADEPGESDDSGAGD
jgi:hypothetical protein